MVEIKLTETLWTFAWRTIHRAGGQFTARFQPVSRTAYRLSAA
jgi:hypothetical protein